MRYRIIRWTLYLYLTFTTSPLIAANPYRVGCDTKEEALTVIRSYGDGGEALQILLHTMNENGEAMCVVSEFGDITILEELSRFPVFVNHAHSVMFVLYKATPPSGGFFYVIDSYTTWGQEV